MVRPRRIYLLPAAALLTAWGALDRVWNPPPGTLAPGWVELILLVAIPAAWLASAAGVYLRKPAARAWFAALAALSVWMGLYAGYGWAPAALIPAFGAAAGSALLLFTGHGKAFFEASPEEWEARYRPVVERRRFLRSPNNGLVKAASLFFFGPATLGISAALLMSGGPDTGGMLALPGLFLLGLSLFFGVLPGIYLFGRQRWARLAGAVLLGSAAFQSVFFLPFMLPDLLLPLAPVLEDGAFPLSRLLLPSLTAAAGAGLNLLQYRLDQSRWAAERERLQPESPVSSNL